MDGFVGKAMQCNGVEAYKIHLWVSVVWLGFGLCSPAVAEVDAIHEHTSLN